MLDSRSSFFSCFIPVSVQMFMPNCSVISLSQLSPLVTLNFFFYACESVSALQMGVFVSVSRSFLGVTAYAALFL